MPLKKSHRSLFRPKYKTFTKLSFTVSIIYLSYLIILPLILAKFIPCLGNHPFSSYTDHQCNLDTVLNLYLILALTGFTILTISLFLILKKYPPLSSKAALKYHSGKTTYLFLSVSAGAMAIILIAAFHLFLPQAEAAVRKAPIILESFK